MLGNNLTTQFSSCTMWSVKSGLELREPYGMLMIKPVSISGQSYAWKMPPLRCYHSGLRYGFYIAQKPWMFGSWENQLGSHSPKYWPKREKWCLEWQRGREIHSGACALFWDTNEWKWNILMAWKKLEPEEAFSRGWGKSLGGALFLISDHSLFTSESYTRLGCLL